jgi:hypothetical protein
MSDTVQLIHRNGSTSLLTGKRARRVLKRARARIAEAGENPPPVEGRDPRKLTLPTDAPPPPPIVRGLKDKRTGKAVTLYAKLPDQGRVLLYGLMDGTAGAWVGEIVELQFPRGDDGASIGRLQPIRCTLGYYVVNDNLVLIRDTGTWKFAGTVAQRGNIAAALVVHKHIMSRIPDAPPIVTSYSRRPEGLEGLKNLPRFRVDDFIKRMGYTEGGRV